MSHVTSAFDLEFDSYMSQWLKDVFKNEKKVAPRLTPKNIQDLLYKVEGDRKRDNWSPLEVKNTPVPKQS